MKQVSLTTALAEEHLYTDAEMAGERSWLRSSLVFLGLFAAIWTCLDAIYLSCPLLRPGAEIVSAAKFDLIVKSRMFPDATRNRIMVFGTSRILAGFMPAAFDPSFGAKTLSYNLGLPGEPRFLPILEAALAAGNVPTHVLLTVPWSSATAPPTWLDQFRDDSETAALLFPFRHLPRDAVLFAVQSRLHLVERYRQAAAERDKVVRDRGWYSIRSEGDHPTNRLPDDFRLPGDTPDRPALRHVPADSWERTRLVSLARRYGFSVILIPVPEREGAIGAPRDPTSAKAHQMSRSPDIRDVGPAAFLYPPRCFSDPVHLNAEGALAYTQALADLLKRSGTLH